MNRHWSIILTIFLISCFNRDLSDDIIAPPEKIYFENGTCKCPDASVGETEVITVSYTHLRAHET